MEFLIYMEKNSDAKVVEMDTVYNDISNGPFLQTFKFREYDLLICIYQTVKDSLHMLDGMVEFMGEDKIAYSKFINLIKTELENIELGIVPPSKDEVFITTVI